VVARYNKEMCDLEAAPILNLETKE